MLIMKENYSNYKGFKFDVDAQSGMQASPLHFAVIFREIKNVELLISLGANVNIQDKEGRTSLHIAVIRLCAHFVTREEEMYDEEMQ